MTNRVSTNTSLCRRETPFYGAETKAPKRSLKSHRQIAETKCVHESPPAQGHSKQPSRRLPRNAAAVIATAKAKNSQPTVSICGLRSCAKDIGNVGEGDAVRCQWT